MRSSRHFIALSILMFFSCHSEPEVRTTTCYSHPTDIVPTGTISANDTSVTYQAIWKALFLEKNNMKQAYFDGHIKVISTGIFKWSEGISFTACYTVTVDWAVVYLCDYIIIQIADGALIVDSKLPVNKLLSKDQIQTTLPNYDYGSYIYPVFSAETNHFPSKNAMILQLMKDAHVNTLCYGGTYIDRETGNLVSYTFAQFTGGGLRCITATADLVTGQTKSSEGSCFIID